MTQERKPGSNAFTETVISKRNNEPMINKNSILVFILCCPFHFGMTMGIQSASGAADTTPDWLNKHFEYLTEGSGIWMTDNSKHQSEQEPFEAYAVHWKYGIGKKSIVGRLYGIKDKKEAGTFWEFRVYWHPGKKKAIIQQFGATGVVGSGEMKVVKQDRKTIQQTLQTFTAPDGSEWLDKHHFVENGDSHQTTSFIKPDDNWMKQRIYVWKRQHVIDD